MAVTIIKKYTSYELDIAEDDLQKGFSFFVTAGGLTLPVAPEQLRQIFDNTPVLYGFLNAAFPLNVVSTLHHDKFQGTLRMTAAFDARIAVTPQLGNFIALNAEKESWSDEEISDLVSSELKTPLSGWFYMRAGLVDLPSLIKAHGESFMTDEDKKEIAEKLPGFLKGTFKSVTVTPLANSEPGAFGSKKQALEEWAAQAGIKPEVVEGVIKQSPTLDIARQKLQEIVNAGEASSYDAQARELARWAEEHGIKRDDAWAVIKSADTLQKARKALEEKAVGGNSFAVQLEALIEEMRRAGLTQTMIDGLIKGTPTIDGIRSRFEQYMAYQKRLDDALTRMVNQFGIPREQALEKLAEAEGSIETLEIIIGETFDYLDKAKRFKEEFSFDSIVKACDEIDRLGGPTRALAVWEGAAKLRRTIPEFARKSQDACVDFTHKNSPEVVMAMIEEYIKKEDAGIKNRRSKLLSFLLIIVLLGGGGAYWFLSMRSGFVLEVLNGNGAVLESVVFSQFGKNFEYGNNSFRIVSTRSAKLKFIERLKKEGHTVTAVSPEKFSVTLAAPAMNSRENWKVDSSFFRNDPRSLEMFRKYLGSSVNGGKADVAAVSREELSTMQRELDAAGIQVTAANGVITLNVKACTFRIRTAPEAAAPAAEILRKFNLSGAGEITLPVAAFNELMAAFAGDSRLGKVERSGDVLMINAPVMQLYSVALPVDSPAEYQKLLGILSTLQGVRIDSRNLVNHADVVIIAELKLASMARNAAEFKEILSNALNGKLKGFRERNLKVK